MRRSRILALALAVVLFGAAAGCGGGDDSDDASVTTADGGSDDTTDDTDDTTDDTTGDERIDDLIEKSREATFRVVYETASGEMIIAQDPPRYALIQGDSGTYQIENGDAVSCSGIDDPDTAECTTLPIGGDFLTQTISGMFGGAFAAILIAAGEDDDVFGTIDLEDDEIAGRDAKCATFDPGSASFVPDTGTWEVCVDEETGATLRSRGTDADGNETDVIEAIEFGEPTDEDLDPPAEPVEITIPTLPD
ncbi:MAG TPA: hypothetical protein VFZ83_13675 [Acidimicrobiia bacterium]|nr:hypothetical protein [Acidimicrobiia bacterium]